MRTQTQKEVKSMRFGLIAMAVSLLLGLATFLVLQFAVGSEKLGFQPVWMLFIVFFLLTGVAYIIYAVAKKRTLYLVFGGGSLIIGLVVLLLCLKVLWWVVLLSAAVLFVILFLMTFITKAPELTVEFDNGPGSNRASYEERAAEKKAQLELERQAEKEKPLPEIKSFKDDQNK